MTINFNKIRQAIKSDHSILVEIWYRSVKKTHHFLTNEKINEFYEGLKSGWLDGVNLYLIQESNQILGFIGLDDNKIEMLFIDDSFQGKGYGKELINFIKTQYQTIFLDVNEQNPLALGFYKKQGFEIIGRSEIDSQGNPFPILHLKYECK